MSHPTSTFHEAEIRDYLPAGPRVAANRADIEIAAAYALFGADVDDTPIGRAVVESLGRELVAPIVGAVLALDGVQVTFTGERS